MTAARMLDPLIPRVPRSKVLVVSLSDAHDRRSRFSARADGTIADWRFFDAHRGLGPSLSYDEAKALEAHGRALQPGELGCYSSHVGAWRALIEGDDDQYIVLEDDVIVDWKMVERIYRHDFSRSGQDYVRLYYKRPCSHLLVDSQFITRSTSLLRLLGKAYGTQGYVITRKGAEQMLQACEGSVVRPIDDHMDRYWEHGIPNYAIFPFPLIEEAVPSKIGSTRFQYAAAKRWRPRWSALKDRVRRRSCELRIKLSHTMRRGLRRTRMM